jgi:uncharacterized membrane protein
MRSARAAQFAIGVGAWLWLAALVGAPRLVFPVGRFICHQRPERSFFIGVQQMPVCARCTGLYAGAALAVPLALALAVSLSAPRARVLLAIAALPTAITWSLEFAGLAPFSNALRFAAALPLGAAAAWLVVSALAESPRRASPASALRRNA